MSGSSLRNSGIPPLGEIPWGTHFCHFYETTEDLLEVVVPYFAAGLEQKELCFWLVAAPLTEESARDALRQAVPDFEQHAASGAIFFRATPEWLQRRGRIEIPALMTEWTDLVDESRKRGYVGLRAAGCQQWLRPAQWQEFHDYEREFDVAMSGKPMLVLCSYPLSNTDAAGILDVADSHEFAVAKRDGKWDVVETPELRLKQLDLRHRQQAAISALGLTAIRERNVGVLLNQAASLAATTLGIERSIVWQARPEQDDLVLRAKFGWDELPAVTTIPLVEGTAARQVIDSDQPVIVTDIPGDTRFEKSWLLLEHRVITIITAVIRGHPRPWGLLSVHSLTPRSFTEDDVAFMQSMANVLGLAMERKEAENERARLLASQTAARALAESALAKLHAIQSITDAALGRMAVDELLNELLARLGRALSTDYAGVLLLNEQRTGFTIRAGDGMDMSKVATVRVPLDSPMAGRVLKEERALILNDVSPTVSAEWQRIFAGLGVSPSSAMGAPLIVEGKVVGVVTVGSRATRQFTEEELELLQMVADRVAPAIERSRLMESVRAARERLEALSRRLLTVQEEERRRVAIELHDELGQVLTAVKIGLESMPAQLLESIASVDRAMQTVRDLALELRPAMLDDLGLASALRWYADRFAQQNRVEMHISIGDVPQLDAGLATTFFRVAQEALTNIARHAAAKNVWLQLHRNSSGLELTIRDDGSGFDVDAARERAARGASLGLLGMEERVSLAGGMLAISSTPEKGTEVRARFPLGGAP